MAQEVFNKALQFAIEAHKGMIRKAKKTPFILHPIEVACIIATMTSDENVISAGLLHDTVEDTSVTIEDIEREFGAYIKELVETETEDKLHHLPAETTWQIRKEKSLEVLQETSDRNVKILWLADKLSNMRSFYQMYLIQGDELWEEFHQNDPNKQKWYYTKVLEYTDELKETAAYKEYEDLIGKVFGGDL